MEQLTVDELAVRVGLPGSTIRMYQTKGVLHPPRRQGRVAYYDASHVERLALVQRLQARGFSLPAIAELVKAREKGASVAAVLGVGDAEGPDDWVRVRVRDISRLVPLGDVRPAILRRAVQLGLIRWRRGWPHARRWALEAGNRLAALSVPSEDTLDNFAKLRRATDGIAADFVEIFERRLWPQLADATDQDDQLDRMRALLVELTYTAETVVIGTLRESIRDAAEEFAVATDCCPVTTSSPPGWVNRCPSRNGWSRRGRTTSSPTSRPSSGSSTGATTTTSRAGDGPRARSGLAGARPRRGPGRARRTVRRGRAQALAWGSADADRLPGGERGGRVPAARALRPEVVVIALIGALVGLRAGYRYDRSIGRPPLRPGGKRLAFWVLLLLVECLVVPSTAALVGPLVGVLAFGYVMTVGLAGPWVSEYYRRRMA